MTLADFEQLIRQPATQLDAHLALLPEGWLWDTTARLLYQLARHTCGPVLEIGSLVGRSTACLALGVRDSGVPRLLVTTDLHFGTTEDFLKYYRAIHGPDVQVPDLQAKYINQGGTRAHLERNLERLGLRDWVTVLTGDFVEVAPRQQYSFVFCDASHDDNEICRNMPGIRSLTRSGSVIMCDDIDSESQFKLVNGFLDFAWCRLMDRVLVGVRR